MSYLENFNSYAKELFSNFPNTTWSFIKFYYNIDFDSTLFLIKGRDILNKREFIWEKLRRGLHAMIH